MAACHTRCGGGTRSPYSDDRFVCSQIVVQALSKMTVSEGDESKGGESMSAGKTLIHTFDPEGGWLYRAGGISALLLGLGYVITIPLYLYVGAPPHEAEAWLTHLAGKTTVWWAILALSVLTDLLFLPVALALYFALKSV